MLRYLTAYVCTTTVFFVLDMVWINVVAHDIYSAGLGPILAAHTNIAAAIEASADAAGIPVSQIDWFVPHQAN